MKRKGFTLIELLAVIIILGILMLIAIPSVTSYINNSRKETYASTVQELIKAASTKVNSGELDMYDTDVTYYIPVSQLKLENGDAKSPYGDFDEAYVIVTTNGEEYSYYFLGKDETNVGIETVTPSSKISKDSIKTNIDSSSISTGIGVGDRSQIMVLSDDGRSFVNSTYLKAIGEDGNKPLVEYPEGKNKKTADVGDLVMIGDQGFYVVSNNGSDLVLLTRYNLMVGTEYQRDPFKVIYTYSEEDDGYGLQNSAMKGAEPHASSYKGVIMYGDENGYGYYFAFKTGEGKKYPPIPEEDNNFNTFDENSSLYNHVMRYKDYIVNLGQPVKEARLLKYSEAVALGCNPTTQRCYSAPSFINNLCYWLYNGSSDWNAWRLCNGHFWGQNCTESSQTGLRPVIVI